jgi:hypothetical protein
MNKLSHTILYVNYTNVTVTSTDCNDLHKTVNANLQLISEWFQINKLVLNKNKTYAINFSWAKTPTDTQNIKLHNQNLILTESSIFFGTHLDTNFSWTLHGKIIEETEYSMQFDGKFVLLSDSRLIKDSLFCTCTASVAILIIVCSSPTNLHNNTLIEQKRKIRVMLGLRQRIFCLQKFKKLQTVTVPILCILEMATFVVKNPDKYKTNVSNHSRNMRQITDFLCNQ